MFINIKNIITEKFNQMAKAGELLKGLLEKKKIGEIEGMSIEQIQAQLASLD